MRKITILSIILILLVSSCTRTAPGRANGTPVPVIGVTDPNQPAIQPVAQSFPISMPPTHLPGQPISSPTPDGNALAFPTFTPLPNSQSQQPSAATTPGMQNYTVQAGDYPSSIAEQFGITTDQLLAANNMGSDAVIFPGDTLLVPAINTPIAPLSGSAGGQLASSDYFKILPDSELVFGPLSALVDVDAYILQQGGFLATFSQEVNGETLTGTQILNRVAHSYSVNPRVLMALLEFRSGWISNPTPSNDYNPIGYVDDFHQGLYRQLTWTANMLNQGFYSWKESKVQYWQLVDGSQVVPQPGINPGTAAVQHFFSQLDGKDTWGMDTGPDGFFLTYTKMFGYPFDLAIEPLIPAGLAQPAFSLPFKSGEVWQFTGGPHAGWDSGSAWAALDFAPPGEPIGCAPSEAWSTAIASGVIIRADYGAVVQDLDGDGLEQTGWTILYMHMDPRDRVQVGTQVKVGDKIGHPSCEGGEANANHLHIARRYNGVWIPAADPRLPFVMEGYVASGTDKQYDGLLTGNGKVIEAWDASNSLNQISK
ncbi:MAG: LysM peptidoglycan-binding domain-containing protein [Chloroflexota bacterium]